LQMPPNSRWQRVAIGFSDYLESQLGTRSFLKVFSASGDPTRAAISSRA
jgi:hypothetical protein